MKNVVIFAITLTLFGCGGDFQTAGFTAQGPDVETGGAMALETGGAPSTGGKAASGGSPAVDSGPAGSGGAPVATGGSPSTGGVVVATGGVPAVDAGCTLVTHDNGLGATWQDCAPSGTHDAEHAMKACRESGAASCVVDITCSDTCFRVYGTSGAQGIASWLYGPECALDGIVVPWGDSLCDVANDRTWG
jgi:hypothetical protein